MEYNNLLCDRQAETAALRLFFRICPSVIPFEQLCLLLLVHPRSVIPQKDRYPALSASFDTDKYLCFRRIMGKRVDDQISHRTAEQPAVNLDSNLIFRTFKLNLTF